MDKIQTTDITKQIIKDIEEKNNNDKGFIAVFLEKNDKKFIINKHYQIKIELDKTKSIYIYDINFKLLGIVYRDFFDNELKDDIIINLFNNVINNYDEEITFDNLFSKDFKSANKHLKPILKKIEKYYEKYFYIETPKKKLYTSDFDKLKIIKNKQFKTTIHNNNQKNSVKVFFNIDELKEDNIYTDINILNYNVSIPMQSNKDILILDTNLYNCNNKINSKILKNKISCILEN
tara:strand:+ start:48 stop:749 length:702 start_codon:yes stop_codon:yes gene_type:complete